MRSTASPPTWRDAEVETPLAPGNRERWLPLAVAASLLAAMVT